MTTTCLWNPPPVYPLPVRGKTERRPVNRIFRVGRNHHAHAVEMGRSVDKRVGVPFYFTKATGTLVEFGASVAYPPGTKHLRYIRMVLWSFFGIRRRAGADEEFAGVKPVPLRVIAFALVSCVAALLIVVANCAAGQSS